MLDETRRRILRRRVAAVIGDETCSSTHTPELSLFGNGAYTKLLSTRLIFDHNDVMSHLPFPFQIAGCAA
jgi:hypothetical protein